MSAVIDSRWSEALALDRRRAPEFYVSSGEVTPGAHAEAIRFALDELGLSAVSCVNGVPTIGFLNDPSFTRSASTNCIGFSGTKV